MRPLGTITETVDYVNHLVTEVGDIDLLAPRS
jgi:hypothetical protein